jgi:hypothetical protein
MKAIPAPHDAGTICEPAEEGSLAKLTKCLLAGMEGVVIVDRQGVVCARPFYGTKLLDLGASWRGSESYPALPMVNAEDVCKKNTDLRILDRRIIKDIIKKSKDQIDPRGIRIIGGIFCDGIDLDGVDIPYSLILDRSIVRGRVDIRNFRTKGDLSLDGSVIYNSILINRSEISGSLWMTYALANYAAISNTSVRGSVELDHSFVVNRLSLENNVVDGDVDLSTMFFSQLEVMKDKIHGVLDLSESQARCTFDIRKSEIGDIVASRLGFGSADAAQGDNIVKSYSFLPLANNRSFGRPLPKGVEDPYDRFMGSNAGIELIKGEFECPADRGIRPGTFVLIDNRIKDSLCIMTFNWLIDQDGKTLKSTIYFNENVIDGAAWLDIGNKSQYVKLAMTGNADSRNPILSIFNVRTGTLVLNFDFTYLDVVLAVNGLQFERIYGSTADCESAISLRGRKRSTTGVNPDEEMKFPPKLELPQTEQVINWINKNTFAGTQQPFAEFVGAFERAGNNEGAKELRITAADAELRASFCGLLPRSWGPHQRLCRSLRPTTDGEARENPPSGFKSLLSSTENTVEFVVRWLEKAIVTFLSFILWLLADHGYRPERIGWYVLGALLFFTFILFPYWLKIVGYSVDSEPNVPKNLGLVFFFDRMLPAYRLREENYRIVRYYVRLKKGDPRTVGHLKIFNQNIAIGEASEMERAKAEWWVDVLRFIGFVFAVFIIAAISKLAH